MIHPERPLLLASASPARRRLLQQAGIPHQIQVSGLDETAFHAADPQRLAEELAAAKAARVRDQLLNHSDLDSWIGVLGCDSLLVFDGEVFGKPADAEEATLRWRRMAGGWGELITGHCLLAPKEPREQRASVTTRVQFSPLREQDITAYVATGEPLACAGGFALEGIGGLAVERIDGCVSNVIGLSLPLLRCWLIRLQVAAG